MRPPRLEPYERPWDRRKRTRRYGRDPVKIEDFNSWYYGRGDAR